MNNDALFNEKVIIFNIDDSESFAVLQSGLHEIWVRKFSSSLKDDINYSPSDCFENFPFPEQRLSEVAIGGAGQTYHDHRAALMVEANEGMTKTYNRFHDPAERSPAIVRLRELHAEMDAAVLRAYGWDDLADSAQARFLTEADEPEYAYQGRLFWPASFRDQVLARLLDLNRERAAEEASARAAK